MRFAQRHPRPNMHGRHRWLRPLPVAGALIVLLALAATGCTGQSQQAGGGGHTASPNPRASQSAPSSQVTIPSGVAAVCGNKSILSAGPVSAPAGAVTVPAGDDSGVNFSQPDTTYWFAPGVHTLGGDQYTQIIPGNGATFTGAPGAILDGQQQNDYAFSGSATNVKISYLTIENFGSRGGNQNEGVVNHQSATGWTITHSTITRNAGAGVMLGSRNTLSHDCISDNQQYGFNAYAAPTPPADLLLDHNEISGNDTYNWEAHIPGCGCTGGGKFWDVDGAVITDNWITGNHSVGLWADTNNRGFEIKDNYIADNYSYGIIYEISYNALITGNTFVRNGIGEGPTNPGFPTSAIYISESGSDDRVPGDYGHVFQISDNKFQNNWGGVILWENSNRYCNSPANTSSGTCTLVDPSVVTLQSCNASNIRKEPYYSDCRWKVQNVAVDHNVFDFNPAEVGSKCTEKNGCGFSGIFSEWGTYPSWSPYTETTVEQHITFDQNNRFFDNSYNGPWEFMAMQQGEMMSWLKWRGSPYGQDQGSTFNLAK
jgi:Right handed beta helix region